MTKLRKELNVLLGLFVFVISHLFGACSNSFEQEYESFEMDYQSSQQGRTLLEQQLESALKKRTRSSEEKLLLLGYNNMSEVASTADLDEALEDIFADSSYIAVQEYETFDFAVHRISDVKEMENGLECKRFDFDQMKASANNRISLYLNEGTIVKLLKLKWLYNNDEIIYSTALATENEGVIFETIGYLIVDQTREEILMDEDITTVCSVMKTRSETPNVTVPDTVKRFVEANTIYNNFGSVLCTYAITCTSTFYSNGILQKRETNAFKHAETGFSCDAQISILSGEIDKSSHNEFAWGWVYGSGSSVSLGFAGNGFTINGDCTGKTGSETHRLN